MVNLIRSKRWEKAMELLREMALKGSKFMGMFQNLHWNQIYRYLIFQSLVNIELCTKKIDIQKKIIFFAKGLKKI